MRKGRVRQGAGWGEAGAEKVDTEQYVLYTLHYYLWRSCRSESSISMEKGEQNI